jgi:desumoylating isopeptidase 1
MRGVNVPELRAQVDLLLFEAFPRELCLLHPVHHLTRLPHLAHAHSPLSLPYLEAVSTEPIMFKAIGSLDAVATKLFHFIGASELPAEEKARMKDTIESATLPFLKLQILPSGKSAVKPLSALAPMLTEWTEASKTLISTLPTEQLFPLVDLWRIGLLSPTVGIWVSGQHASTPDITSTFIHDFLKKAELKPLPRSFILTLLKFFSNAFSVSPLSQRLLAPGPLREKLTDLAISQLLEEENQIRATAASLVFNIASCTQTQRAETGRSHSIRRFHEGLDAEWEIEVVSAVIEGIRREENEEIRKYSAGPKSRSFKVTQSIGWLPVWGSSFGCLQHMRTSYRNYWKYFRLESCWRRKPPQWLRRLTSSA